MGVNFNYPLIAPLTLIMSKRKTEIFQNFPGEKPHLCEGREYINCYSWSIWPRCKVTCTVIAVAPLWRSCDFTPPWKNFEIFEIAVGNFLAKNLLSVVLFGIINNVSGISTNRTNVPTDQHNTLQSFLGSRDCVQGNSTLQPPPQIQPWL